VPRPVGDYPYRTQRQFHIGDGLDDLQARGLISSWRLVFGHPAHRKRWEIDRGAKPLALWCVRDFTDVRQVLETREAEQYILRRCLQNGIEWAPVPAQAGWDAATPLRAELARRGVTGADVLAYAAIVEHLRWQGVYEDKNFAVP